MNRSQRRRQQFGNRQRGVGFTRQYSSRRARLQHGAVQKPSRNLLRMIRALMQQQERVVVESDPISITDEFVLNNDGSAFGTKIETFDLLGEDTTTDSSIDSSDVGSDDLNRYLSEWSAKDIIAAIAGGDFDLVLGELRQHEYNGKSRITVLKSIDARIKIQTEKSTVNTSGVVPPEGIVLGQTTAAELAAR